ncbi:hypothetical protein DP113_15945 [Brasilonema octagenarum UFV-E1]|uniref:Aminoglycoside phosphotransferase domain-containing protein n=1 Tax=Brasilonema sennae CENA114 TaxID=415709 RepID=A0A856MEX7_9CYAN|nr:macrolide 2'-phosphotransferase [Brasilonema sennae]QDL09202.1 hypothetical protein DP114_16010 [Brasilonema sennae CENA114]QDL15560.1 hypothetical protein DP113_15945 [Brasilonema octagenarum UFV-E1]
MKPIINSTAEFLAVAQKHGLRLNAENVELNASGVDFLVAFATDEDGIPWVLRAPRRSDVIERAANENRVLNLLRKHLPVAVPEWRVNTEDLIAYPRLAGTPAATVNPVAKNYDWYIDQQSPSVTFVDSLAGAIAGLHTIDHDAACEAGVRVLQPVEVRQSLAKKMDQAKPLLRVSDLVWQRWQNWLADDTYWPKHSALIHGDLHPGHMLVDQDHRVTGLIDWTEAEVADPATDFAAYYAIFGESALADLLQRYQDAGGRVWPRMQDHIVELYCACPVAIAMFVLLTGDDTYLEPAQMMLSAHEQQMAGLG